MRIKRVCTEDGQVYILRKVTRYSEGASLEDIENGDAYETAYIVDDAEGNNIWDTTDFENVRWFYTDCLDLSECWTLNIVDFSKPDTYSGGYEETVTYHWGYRDAMMEAKDFKGRHGTGYAIRIWSPHGNLIHEEIT